MRAPPKLEPVALPHGYHGHAEFTGHLADVMPFVAFGSRADPKLLGMEIFEHRAQPADVIFMRMGDRHYVEPLDRSGP